MTSGVPGRQVFIFIGQNELNEAILMSIFYVDGDFVNEQEARIPLADLAVLRGFAVFDFLRTYGGRPFQLDEHIHRLRRSADLIGLNYPWSDADLINAVYETLKRNPDHDESDIRIVMTGGLSPNNLLPEPGAARLLIMVQPVTRLPAEHYEKGHAVITVDLARILPAAKTTNYITAVMAMQRARAANAIEALYTTPTGHVTEATTSNLFMFQGQHLITPVEDVLPGITRQVVLRCVDGLFPVTIRAITLDELLTADEIFITSSVKEVLPIVRVDAHTIGDGRPGPNTRRVMARFREETRLAATASR